MSDLLLGRRVRATVDITGKLLVVEGEVVGAEVAKGDGWVLLVRTAEGKLENLAVYFYDVRVL